uniref:Uncharacterized protein n=1 Tax=Chelydra serpentina TaxID=8475 RepID=A0A8C3SFD1_CHESE
TESGCVVGVEILIKDGVPTIGWCKHKFCRFCVTPFKGESGTATSCPLCHKAPRHGEDKPQEQPDHGADEAEKISLEVGEEPEVEWECGEHQAVLDLFCAEDQAPICMSCRDSQAHCTHTVVPIEEAAQEYKVGKLQTAVELLKKQTEESWELKYQEGKKTADWKTHYQKMCIEIEFEKLHEFLNEEEERLLRKLRKEEKETLKKLHGNIMKLSEQHSSLQKLITEIEEKCQQPAAALLKVRNSPTPSIHAELTAVFTELKNVYNIPSIDIIDILRKFKGNDFVTFLSLFSSVDVTLDPDTAHPNLILSEDRRSMTHGGMRQELPSNPERFDPYIMVLGSRRFTSGKCYWEVEVGDKVEWDVGVCRESVGRKGQVILSPSNGFWRVWLRNGDKYKALISHPTPLTVSVRPSRVGIFLDYKAGEISFYNVTDRTHLYSYSGSKNSPFHKYLPPLTLSPPCVTLLLYGSDLAP